MGKGLAVFRFERLQVWRKAIDLYDSTDRTVQEVPEEFRFSLTDQIRRAALSVSSNIAEGSGRETAREARHFYTMAKASVFELVSLITICQRRHLISEDRFREMYTSAEEISKMLTGLKRSSQDS